VTRGELIAEKISENSNGKEIARRTLEEGFLAYLKLGRRSCGEHSLGGGASSENNKLKH